MALTVAAQPTLIDSVWPARERMWLRWAVLAVLGSLLLTASAKLKVPFEPVPITMQTFAVLVIGMAYGWRLALATLLLYLGEGAVGIPVFTDTPQRGVGIAYMTGTTGGYLLGFAIAATAMGWLAERGWDRNIVTALGAMLIGTVLMFVPGVTWLALHIGWPNAIKFGLVPFVYGEVLKLALAAAVMPLAWRGLGRARR